MAILLMDDIFDELDALLAAFKAFWDRLVAEWSGKKLAILGERGVGKTHLLTFLSSGSIPAVYKQTVAPEKTKPHRFQLKALNIKVKGGLDVSGDKAAYAEWKKLHDDADIVFYLLRADRLIAGDKQVENRVRGDLTHIGGWLQDRQSRPKFFIIGTHCDLDPEFPGGSDNKFGDYFDRFRGLPIVSELLIRAGGAQHSKVILGSMQSRQGTEELVYEIFRQVSA